MHNGWCWFIPEWHRHISIRSCHCSYIAILNSRCRFYLSNTDTSISGLTITHTSRCLIVGCWLYLSNTDTSISGLTITHISRCLMVGVGWYLSDTDTSISGLTIIYTSRCTMVGCWFIPEWHRHISIRSYHRLYIAMHNGRCWFYLSNTDTSVSGLAITYTSRCTMVGVGSTWVIPTHQYQVLPSPIHRDAQWSVLVLPE
jgi:hypothetical protein